MRGCTPQPVRGEETEARRGGVGARGPSWSAAPWLAGLRVGTASRLPFPPRMSFRLPSSCLRVPHLGNLTSPPDSMHGRAPTPPFGLGVVCGVPCDQVLGCPSLWTGRCLRSDPASSCPAAPQALAADISYKRRN